MYPCIENTRTIDAKKHTQTVEFLGIVGMRKGIDTAVRIIVHISEHTIYYAWSTGSTCYLARIEHIQADCIVWLVACTIWNRCAFLESQLLSCLLGNYALYWESRNDVGQHTLVKSVVIKQELGRFLLLEIPHHTFRKSADGCLYLARQFHGQIVTGQHDFVYLVKQLWLILLDPSQFGSSKIAWWIEQALQTTLFAKITESLITIRHGTRITPDDTWTQHVLLLVHAHQTVHLIWNTYSKDVFSLGTSLCHNSLKRQLGIVPPHLWVLLCPPCLDSHDRCLMVRIKSWCGNFATVNICKRCFHRTGAYVKAQ